MLTSMSNERVKLVRGLQSQRKTREKESRFVIEGIRLVEDALRAKADFDFVFYEEMKDDRAQKLLDALTERGVNMIQTSGEIMRAVADTEHPQSMLAVIKNKKIMAKDSTMNPNALILICDRISDPGNLGTLLRTAAAADINWVWLSPETVDVFNPKVVRAGMGAHFRLSIESLSWDEISERAKNLRVRLADAQQNSENEIRYDLADWSQTCALIVSSEAEGASDEARALAHESVFIPMMNEMESLNAGVAGSIILFEAVRQRSNLRKES